MQRSNVKSENTKVRAYKFSLEIIKFIASVDLKIVHKAILDQLIRSATSIGANMVEAQSASSKRDFLNYYQIALKSSNETKYWLCLLKDSYPQIEIKSSLLLKEVTEISNMLGASVIKLKEKR
jgi:four helix bundle protein